jgi:hypothetical protein
MPVSRITSAIKKAATETIRSEADIRSSPDARWRS